VQRPLGLTDAQMAGLRNALTAVAEAGTATGILRATVGQGAELSIAGKTGTAQNAHGLDHRWFIAMAPADHPQLVVGGIMENVGLHDPVIVRNVILALRRYVLGPETAKAASATAKAIETFSADTAGTPDDEAPDTAARRAADSSGGAVSR
jgi:penicillin-binding protein 2